jgi:hypothetical protein
MRRREVLKAAGLALTPLPALAAGAAPAAAIFDSRHAASRAWADAWPAAMRFDAQEDVARLWRGPLAGRARIAGLTTWADFQVISGLAAEARRKVRHSLVRQSGSTLVFWDLT